MNENNHNENGFIGHEYRTITVKRSMVDLYADCLPSFGWKLEKTLMSVTPTSVIMKFKRERKIINKAELTRLQHEFESRANEINRLETSKIVSASAAAYGIGIAGTAFMAGSVFAVTSGMIPLCIILAVPALVGWVLPYLSFRRISEKQTEKVTPLIDNEYDAIYATCEKAGALLYN